VVEALSNLLVVSRIEELLASVYAFFAEVMQSKGLKILKNITTWWISMLAPTVRVMNEYKVLLVKMAMDSKPAQRDVNGKKVPRDKKLVNLAKKNLAFLSDIQILLGLSGLLPLLRCVHSLMKFSQGRDIFVCDYMAAIQVCISEITAFYIDDTTAFSQDIFWDFKALEQVRHDAIPMSWVDAAFDLNESDGIEHAHLYFSPPGHSIQAYHLYGDGQKSAVTRALYVDIISDVKSLCKG
jgi:hypothetical protein